MINKKLGESGKRVLIEEFLDGFEKVLLLLTIILIYL